jgi:hypothetical protein
MKLARKIFERIKPMRSFWTTGFFVALLAFSGIEPAFPQVAEDAPYQEWVEYRDGEISVAFDQTPVEIALYAIRARTGFQIILPSATESKPLNLRLNRLPLEPAVRSLITSIGFKNFAVMYDDTGRPNRAVVLRARLEDRASLTANSNPTSQAKKPEPQPLSVEERDKLQKELEHWSELRQEERDRLEDRLKSLPASEEREQLVNEYGRQILGIKK